MRLMTLGLSVGLMVAAIVVAGCSTSAGKHDAADVAARFVAAVSAGDGAVACGLLTEQARESVSGATDANCAEAVLNVDEHGSPVHRVAVCGAGADRHRCGLPRAPAHGVACLRGGLPATAACALQVRG